MLSLFLLAEVNGEKMPVTLNEILDLLREDEKGDFKKLISLCREDQALIQELAKKKNLSDEDIQSIAERLFENTFSFYLIVKERLGTKLRGSSRTMDAIMSGDLGEGSRLN